LRNVIERALILEDDDVITTKYVPVSVVAGPNQSLSEGDRLGAHDMFRLPPAGASLEEVELSLVRQAIERSCGNQTRAAELLGISRDQLRYRLKKLEEANVAEGQTV
jgi:DNA-binding NtrC family response regulator